MRITSKLLRTHCGVRQCTSLSNIEYLDLTNNGIVLIERLNQCPKLHTLLLSGNQIDVLDNVDKCPELWKLDVSNNKLRYLDGLLPFVGLGTLNLSNNQLQWAELEKIRHMFLLDVHLHGNPELEKDPNYRLHVIDCLPNAWAVDGRPVTSSERCQVAHFFQRSACSNQPVRHKLSRDRFIPTSRQNIHVRGVYGRRVSEFCALFPAAGTDPNHVTDTSDTDRSKLMFYAKNLQEELLLDVKFRKKDYLVCHQHAHFMEELLLLRPDDRESSNMLLLLLVASLEFVLPITLVENTLEVARLAKVGSIDTMNVFMLPRDMRWSVAVILLTAAKLDRETQHNGGLYEQLYLCIHCVLTDLVRIRFVDDELAKSVRAKQNTMKKDHRSLLASELVQLLCIVPVFFQLLDKEMGLMNLIVTATGDAKMIDKLSQLVKHIPSSKDLSRVYLEIADHLLAAMQHHSTKLFTRAYKHRMTIEPHLMASILPVRPLSSPIYKSEYLTSGRNLPSSPRRALSGKQRKTDVRAPILGDAILLGPQTVGRVVSVPQTGMVMVQMSAVPVANGSMMSFITKTSADFFRYVSMSDVEWDTEAGYWRPKGTVGDRITIQSIYEEADDILESSSLSTDQRNAVPQNRPFNSTGSLVVSKSHPSEVAAKPKLFEFPRPISCVLAEKLDLKLDINDTDDKHRPFTAQAQTHQQREEESSLFRAVQDAVVNVAGNVSRRDVPEVERPPSSRISVFEDQNKVAGKTSAADEKIVVPFNDEQDDANTETETLNEDVARTDGTRDGDEVLSNGRRHDNDRSAWTEIEREHNQTNDRNQEALNGLHEAASNIMQYRFRNEGESVTISEAYRYLINKPERRTKSAYARPDHVTASRVLIGQFREEKGQGYKTPFQLERTESWKQSAKKSPKKGSQLLLSTAAPPPQRPSSPSLSHESLQPVDQTDRSNEQLVVNDGQSSCIRRVDRWLGGGKDLYTEELQNRPRHKNEPGWREGMRAKSAVIRPRPRPKTALTPSALNHLFGTVNGYNHRDPSRDVEKRPLEHTTRSDRHLHRIVYPAHRTPQRPGPVCGDCRHESPRPINVLLPLSRPLTSPVTSEEPIGDEMTDRLPRIDHHYGDHHVVRFEIPYSR